MSTSDEERFIGILHKICGKYTWIILGTVIVFAFTVGVWFARLEAHIEKLDDKVAQLLDNDKEQEEALQKRLVTWGAWRDSIDKTLRDSLAERFSASDYDLAVYIARKKNPDFAMPYKSELRGFHE